MTTEFYEPRPLSKSPDERDHIHGAIDIGAGVGEYIRAPEAGELYGWAAFRGEPGIYWASMRIIADGPFQGCNYFYDTFGGVLLLITPKRMHVITHSYASQLFNKYIFNENKYYEERKDSRFPLHAIYAGPIRVRAGAVIGYVGNAGYTSGSHVHWEIHHGHTWERWEKRINPERWK
jgi:hypothetical protein